MATAGTCEKSGCTVADTGICLMTHAQLSDCPTFRAVQITTRPKEAPATGHAVSPLRSLASSARTFPLGFELGTRDAAEIMRARYSYVVGILGDHNAGKTCFLLSLYLMASRGVLPSGYVFAGSQTLPGFENRARRLRRWKGGPLPQQLADHTTLNERQAGFLHFAMRERRGERRQIDLLLTDLPGEWSTNLIDRAAAADRLEFLKRADGLIVVLDGPLLVSPTRHVELQRARHLIERLVQAVGVQTATPIVILIAKSDEIRMQRPAVVDELQAHSVSLGFAPTVLLCAAFSRSPEVVANGAGVFEAIEAIVAAPSSPRVATVQPVVTLGRQFLQFR